MYEIGYITFKSTFLLLLGMDERTEDRLINRVITIKKVYNVLTIVALALEEMGKFYFLC